MTHRLRPYGAEENTVLLDLPMLSNDTFVRGITPFQMPTVGDANGDRYVLDYEKAVAGHFGGTAVKAEETRFDGARRVENVIKTTSEDFSNAAWIKGATATVTGTNILNFPAASDIVYQSYSSFNGQTSIWTIKISGTPGKTITLHNAAAGVNAKYVHTLTAEPQIISIAATATITGGTSAGIAFIRRDTTDTATQVTVDWAMLEESTGRIDTTTPSEYVSVGVLSSPWHGANVDGVKYFDTTNGNSVASNVVTEATGAPLRSYLLSPDQAANTASTPDSASISVTGDIEMQIIINAATFDTTSAFGRAHWVAKGSLGLAISTLEKLIFLYSTGTTRQDHCTVTVASVGIASGDTARFKVTHNTTTGDTKFYYTLDLSSANPTWTQMGTTVAGATGALLDETAALSVGDNLSHATGFGSVWKIHDFKLYNGIGGTLVSHMDADDSKNTNSWDSVDTGETWTVNNTASIQGGLKGYFAEGVAANLALWNRDWTNAAWVKSNMTTAKTSVGIDGQPNSATRLTASAANATALQTVTIASAAYDYAVRLKRITGTGNVDITDNNGTNWTTVTLTSSWKTFHLARTQANPVFGVRIVTSADAVDVDFAALQTGSFYTSPHVVGATADTRPSDAGATLNISNWNDVFSIEADITPNFNIAPPAVEAFFAPDSGDTTEGFGFDTTAKQLIMDDGTNTVTLGSAWSLTGETFHFKARGSNALQNLSSNGTKGTKGTYDDSYNAATSISLCNTTYGCSIKNLKIYRKDLGETWLSQ